MKRKPKAKAKIAKEQSDIFICKRATGEYWAYPSPFVAHGPQAEIRFRNLTGDDITIDFGDASRNSTILNLKKRKRGVVTLARGAAPGLHEYVATVSGKQHQLRGSKHCLPVLVRGGSPPEIIIDT